MLSELLNPSVQQYILEHEKDDVNSLILKGKSIEGVSAKVIAEQISSRRKAGEKLPFLLSASNIIFPPKLSMEQCSSELTARYKSQLLKGNSIADLTGGAGIDSYFFSQQFRSVDYVEMNADLATITNHNFSQLEATNITTHTTTAEKFLANEENSYDVIYLDPARRDTNKNKVFKFTDCTPDITQLLPGLLKKANTVLIKASPMIDIHQGIKELSHIQNIHIIAINNDCKEVLYFLNNNHERKIKVVCSNYTNIKGWEEFQFSLEEESLTVSNFSWPKKFIYESNVAILKAGAFKSVGEYYKLDKLEVNSHLYTSDNLLKDFPGRAFELVQVLGYNKKALQAAIPSKKANVTTRNFPDSVEAIRKKTGLRPGGENYLFATTLMNGKKVILLTKKAG